MATQLAMLEVGGRPDCAQRAGNSRVSALRMARMRRSCLRSEKNGEAINSERQALLLAMVPLVKRVAFEMRQHLPVHVEMNDLMSAGTLGLVDAIRKFDPSKNVKIETYARHRIRGGILDSLRSLDPATRDMRKRVRKVERTYCELEAKLGRPASDEEIANALGVSLNIWHRWAREIHHLGYDGGHRCETATTAMCPLPKKEDDWMAAQQDDPFDLCYRREQRDLLNCALAGLPERERLIIALYYQQDLTMKQIAARLGVDESRISQLHSEALRQVKTRLTASLHPPQTDKPAPFAA